MSVILVILVVLVVLYIIGFFIARYLFYDDQECKENPDLTDKVFVVTGTTGGLGKETALFLLQHNATVVMLNRSLEKSEAVELELIDKAAAGKVESVVCDLNDLESVRMASKTVADHFDHVDCVIANAGVLDGKLLETEQGFEHQYGVNVLGTFVLVMGLLPSLKKAEKSRVVILSSCASWAATDFDDRTLKESDFKEKNIKFDVLATYSRTKFALLVLAKEFQRRFSGENIKFVPCAPGIIYTRLWRTVSRPMDWLVRYVAGPVLKTIKQGAQTEIQCAVCPFEELKGGCFYDHCAPAPSNPSADIMEIADKIWNSCVRDAGSFVDDKSCLESPRKAEVDSVPLSPFGKSVWDVCSKLF